MLGLRFCARAFSSCGKRGPLFIAVRGPLTIAASPVAEHGLQTRRLSSRGTRAQLLRGMWDLPRPGLEPVSPALAGRFSTTAPPGKPLLLSFMSCLNEQLKCPSQMNIDGVVYMYHGIFLSHKKEWNIAICSNTDGPRDFHSKWSKADRERQILYGIKYICDLKNNANKSIYKTETESETWKTTYGYQREKGREGQIRSLGLTDTIIYM